PHPTRHPLRTRGGSMHYPAPGIRAATPYDTDALARLAELSDRRPLRGHILVAERESTIVAAIEVTSGAIIAESPDSIARLEPSPRRSRYQVLRQAGGFGHARLALRRDRSDGTGRPTTRPGSRVTRVIVAGVVAALAAAGSAAAFQALPPGAQVNDDAAA